MLEYNEPLTSKQLSDIKKILTSYKLPTSIDVLSLTQALRRVDIIQKELALMQAANESAWGTSRFARIGLNFLANGVITKAVAWYHDVVQMRRLMK